MSCHVTFYYFIELQWKDESKHEKNAHIDIQDGEFIYVKLPEFIAYPPGSISVEWSSVDKHGQRAVLTQDKLTLKKNLFFQIIRKQEHVTQVEAIIKHELSRSHLLFKCTINTKGIIFLRTFYPELSPQC